MLQASRPFPSLCLAYLLPRYEHTALVSLFHLVLEGPETLSSLLARILSAMGLKMAEFEAYPVPDYFSKPELEPESVSTPAPAPAQDDPPFLPYWARSRVQCAQNLLACSDEPIEYDHDDEDYRDNCFFFPEDCSWTPPKDWVVEAHCLPTREIPKIRVDAAIDPQDKSTPTPTPDTMIPGLPDIKMLDAEALGDLLEDNLSPPEITTILYVPSPTNTHPLPSSPSQINISAPPASSQPTVPSSPTPPPSPPGTSATSAQPTAPPTPATQRPPQPAT